MLAPRFRPELGGVTSLHKCPRARDGVRCCVLDVLGALVFREGMVSGCIVVGRALIHYERVDIIGANPNHKLWGPPVEKRVVLGGVYECFEIV